MVQHKILLKETDNDILLDVFSEDGFRGNIFCDNTLLDLNSTWAKKFSPHGQQALLTSLRNKVKQRRDNNQKHWQHEKNQYIEAARINKLIDSGKLSITASSKKTSFICDGEKGPFGKGGLYIRPGAARGEIFAVYKGPHHNQLVLYECPFNMQGEFQQLVKHRGSKFRPGEIVPPFSAKQNYVNQIISFFKGDRTKTKSRK